MATLKQTKTICTRVFVGNLLSFNMFIFKKKNYLIEIIMLFSWKLFTVQHFFQRLLHVLLYFRPCEAC